jgi:hypothetical protein
MVRYPKNQPRSLEAAGIFGPQKQSARPRERSRANALCNGVVLLNWMDLPECAGGMSRTLDKFARE